MITKRKGKIVLLNITPLTNKKLKLIFVSILTPTGIKERGKGSFKEYYEPHKNNMMVYFTEYDEAHKDDMKVYFSKYYEAHKDEMKVSFIEYNEAHKD